MGVSAVGQANADFYHTPVTDDLYDAWLAGNNRRPVILVEAQHSGGTYYFGSAPFVSSPWDTNPNRGYEDILDGPITIDYRLDREVVGDISVIAKHSDWLDLNWRGYSLKVLFGDARWRLDDFRTVVDGKNGGISSPRHDRYKFIVADFGEVLEQEIGSEAAPLTFGNCFNVRPALIDNVNLTYKVHDGAVTAVTVRDNGLVVSPASTDLPNGEFDLSSAPAGQVTVDVQQADTAAADIVAAICDLVSCSYNSSNFAAFPNTDNLGRHVNRATPARTVIDDVLRSVGGGRRFNTANELEIYRLDVPGTSTLTITRNQIHEHGMRHLSAEEPCKLLTLGYKRNWFVQPADALAGAVSAQSREDYATEYKTVTSSNTLTNFPLAKDRRKDTLIETQSDAQDEADRLQAIRDDKRDIYLVPTYLAAGSVQRGQTVTIEYDGYGFENGEDVVVIGYKRSLGRAGLELTVWK